ncbi:hypothetical protein I8752_29970 [Nostocaceae cyanobacterium CENA369]|uniref:DNA topoisomerase (ATP-hydrolyzing) n=1 Tax=Dendronalium phyllosphericum CENA369 TaxID=1725256 RepID=A0A8J7LGK5_9NOST|nr:hypothetical protein [Dendronalium phyllosphericum]MBH8577132.1 hypothetical protein [Dendronalium phyllosphericum CENA369]
MNEESALSEYEKEVQAIRRRPGMYFGSTSTKGVEHFVYELVANVLDAFLVNQATFVNVEINEAVISVTDDGLGLPFDEPSDENAVSLATKFLTRIHSTPSRNEHAPHVHMTMLGIGLAPMNAASSQLTVRSWRSGALWEQRFSRGFTLGSATIIERGNGRGTNIEVIPDPEIFRQAKPRWGVIRRALFETAHLYSGFKIGFHQERFYAPKGLQMLGFMLLDPLSLDNEPNAVPFHVTMHYENVFIEAAAFGDGPRTRMFSWVNGARTPKHGSHVEGFSQALKEVDWNPSLGLIHIIMYDPRFAGPVRHQLDVPHIRKLVQDALRESLRQYRGKSNE